MVFFPGDKPKSARSINLSLCQPDGAAERGNDPVQYHDDLYRSGITLPAPLPVIPQDIFSPVKVSGAVNVSIAGITGPAFYDDNQNESGLFGTDPNILNPRGGSAGNSRSTRTPSPNPSVKSVRSIISVKEAKQSSEDDC